MIRKKCFLGKIYFLNKSAKSIVDAYLRRFVPSIEECPSCHAKGCCWIHGYYTRNLIDFYNGAVCYDTVQVTRVECSECGATHAILHDIIVPYFQYSLPFLLRVVADRLILRKTVQRICDTYLITVPAYYRIMALFHKHKSLWLGILDDLETSDTTFVRKLWYSPDLSAFLMGFFQKTGRSFLQHHANPPSHSPRSRRKRKHRRTTPHDS